MADYRFEARISATGAESRKRSWRAIRLYYGVHQLRKRRPRVGTWSRISVILELLLLLFARFLLSEFWVQGYPCIASSI